jgi:hypothetical protein
MMSGADIAGIILVSGLVAGGAWDRVKRLATDRQAARERLANGPEPICGCGHHLAFHDLHDGRCYAEVKRKGAGGGAKSAADSAASAETGDESAAGSGAGAASANRTGQASADPVWRQCRCRRYAGPEPLATMYAPPIARAGYEETPFEQVGSAAAPALATPEPEDSED